MKKRERLVAIKMVSKGVLASEEARRHFRREALALAKLNHPRIASVYDVGEQDGADFLVMNWCRDSRWRRSCERDLCR